jgi:ATP-dependent DNA helicase 2 subunit 2
MAQKEALIIIIDVGSTMSREANPSGFESACSGALQQLLVACWSSHSHTLTTHIGAIRAAQELVKQKLLFANKQQQIAVLLAGTAATRNSLWKAEQAGYEHVSVLRDFGAPDLALLRAMQSDALPPCNATVDVLDAVIVAMDMFVKHAGVGVDRKATKRILLVTDAGSPCDAAGLDQVVAKFNELDCSLNVIGVDFDEVDDDAQHLIGADDDDDDNNNNNDGAAAAPADDDVDDLDASKLASERSSKRPPTVTVTPAPPTSTKSATKRANEALLRNVAQRVRGAVWPVHSALEALAGMRSRAVLQRSSCRPLLELGSDVKFPVHLFVKTTEQKFPSLQKVSLVALEAAEEGVPCTAKVKLQRTYYSMADPDTPVLHEHQIKAYKYGKNLVPFSSIHEDQMKYKAEKCLQLLGTFPADKVPRWYHMRSVEIITAAPGDAHAPKVLSAFTHALSETAHVAICRYVKMNNKEPKLVALAPEVVDGELSLVATVLPFVESVREYQFPRIDATTCTNPRIKPSAEQMAAMRAYIESLDLMTAATNNVGEPCEALVPELTFNPVLQYFYQCVQHRALNPLDALPAPSAEILGLVKPPASLNGPREAMCARVAAAFPLERVAPKVAKKRDAWEAGLQGADVRLDSYLQPADGGGAEAAASSSSSAAAAAAAAAGGLFAPVTLDAMALANGVETINSVTPVADFEAMLRRRDVDLVGKAIHEMCTYIEQAVEQSLGHQYHSKALECVQALRRGCKAPSIAESERFNHWLRHVRAKWEKGTHNSFWELLASCNITLIHADEADDSAVSRHEAANFLAGPAPPVSASPGPHVPQDAPADVDELEDLLAGAD